MENLRLIKIDERYIRFLRSRDEKVQDNKGRKRPYVGVVITVGAFKYFVPMESPKPNHAKMKPGKHLMKIRNGQLGLLGFNNMIPVRDEAVIEFDIDGEADPKYRKLLREQMDELNRNKADVYDKASKTYYDVVNKKNRFLMNISCDFLTLEKACNEYRPKIK